MFRPVVAFQRRVEDALPWLHGRLLPGVEGSARCRACGVARGEGAGLAGSWGGVKSPKSIFTTYK